MVEIGIINKLRVVKELDFGIYLDGGSDGEILMPKRYVPEGCKPEDVIDAFIYFDSEDRIIATTDIPVAMVGDFALLEAVSTGTIGAFVDWGLAKDLLVPYAEQSHSMEVGTKYMVYIYIDERTRRIVGSTKLDKYLDNVPPTYQYAQEVDLIIASKTDLGYKAIVNKLHWGILYQNEVFQTLQRGQHIKGYIKKVRDDEKIDLVLQRPGYERALTLAETILEKLSKSGGFIEVTDKTNPETIYSMFGVSKKAFKMAIGSLYKSKLIAIEKNGIRKVIVE